MKQSRRSRIILELGAGWPVEQMSIDAMKWVWKYSETKGSERLVLLALADHADEKWQCWPSLTSIANKCRLHRRYVINILNKLEEGGHITRSQGIKKSTLYTIVRAISSDAGSTSTSDAGDTRTSEQDSTSENGLVNYTALASEAGSTRASEAGDTRLVTPAAPEPSYNHHIEPSENHNNNSGFVAIYENEIGALTPLVADQLREWGETYDEAWIIDAIREAVKNNVRKANYIDAILKNWKTAGGRTGKPTRTNGHSTAGAQPSPPAPSPEEIRRRLREAESFA